MRRRMRGAALPAVGAQATLGMDARGVAQAIPGVGRGGEGLDWKPKPSCIQGWASSSWGGALQSLERQGWLEDERRAIS